MAKHESFRQILTAFLNEKALPTNENQSPTTHAEVPFIPALHLNIDIKRRPEVKKAFPTQFGRMKVSPASVQTKESRQKTTPLEIDLKQLPPLAQKALAQILELDGNVLPSKFSRQQLKQVFRRLAKNFHPDSHQQKTASLQRSGSLMFIRLRKNYKIVEQALKLAENT